MDLDEVVRRRRMCRDFSDRPVDPHLVERLLERARRAPSAGNSQGWGFLVLERPQDRDRFWRVTSDPEWMADPSPAGLVRAPVIVVPLCSSRIYLDRYAEPDKVAHGLTTEETWPVPFWTVDVSFATMLLLLAVVDEGLGALFFGFRTTEAIDRFRAEFSVPPEWSPIGVVALGWPSTPDFRPGGSAARPRRPLADVVHRGHWGGR